MSTSEAIAARRPFSLGRTLAWMGDKGIYFTFLALVVFNGVFTNNFATMVTFWNILVQVAPIVLVSLGMAMVIGTGGIDISVGSIMAIASAIVPLTLGYGWWVAVICGLLGGALVGAFNGFFVSVVGMQPIVATLALLVGGRGLAQVLVGGYLQIIYDKQFLALGRARILGIPFPVIVAAVTAIIMAFIVSRTTLGRYVQSVGANRQAAYLSGHPVRWVLMSVYIISGFLAGIAGVLATARLAASDPAKIGLLMELDAIAAVVVGGTALVGGRVSIPKTIMGALLVQVITATFIMNNLSPIWAQVLKGIIIVLAVYIQRRGRMT